MICYFNSGAVGEFLMTLYFADVVAESAQKDGKPISKVYIAVRRNALLLKELAQYYPNVEVVSFSPRETFRGICLLGSKRLSYIITQQTFGRISLRMKIVAWMCAKLSGAALVGFDDGTPHNFLWYTKRWQFDITSLFPIEMSKLAARLGYPNEYRQPRLRWKTTTHTKGTHIVLHLRAFTSSRSLPAERWRALIVRMRHEWPDRTFIFSGAPNDAEFIDEAIQNIPKCENRAGRQSIPALIDALDTAAVYVGVDTGITHLAAFRGVSAVILGNRSNPCWWSTYAPQTHWLVAPRRCTCRGDKTGDCVEMIDGKKYYRCLIDITEEQVIRELQKIV